MRWKLGVALTCVVAFAIGVVAGPWVFGSSALGGTSIALEPITPATSSSSSEVTYGTEAPSIPIATPSLSPAQEANLLAGVRGDTVPPAGTGVLVVAAGSVPAPPGDAPIVSVRVEIEEGLDVDHAQFATFVLNTLNDPRGWSSMGLARFARTDGDADFRVVLASRDTVAQVCLPVDTEGWLSCGRDGLAGLNAERWFYGADAFLDAGGDLTGYRHYLVNHEVGHLLNQPHQTCPAPGEVAPVMVQQTISVDGCEPSGWPAP
ncbi:MAG: DUF3152 domain-containing protein [Beutenbergiaceae bacterium]